MSNHLLTLKYNTKIIIFQVRRIFGKVIIM